MISIITATYNSAETINDTIKSVLCQTNKDFEYIIVDGGSTDETIDIVKSCESEFSGRLKWVSEKDKGIYDAMNKGIKMASGDIIGILNSDDFYTDEDVLQTVAEVMTEAVASIGEKLSLRRFEVYTTEDGQLATYIHMGGKIGVIVELSGGDATLGKDVAMQIAVVGLLCRCRRFDVDHWFGSWRSRNGLSIYRYSFICYIIGV